MATSFGPSALVTPANAISVGRLVLAPVMLAIIASSGDSWPGVLLWIALAVSDGFDGYLARRHGRTTSGAFLDPLADKVLVLGALLVLAGEGIFPWIPVLVIGVREVVISLYRTWWSRRGVSLPARWWAKVKTVVQEVAVGLALLPLAADQGWLAEGVLWTAVVLTVVTGAQYLLDGQRVASEL